MSPRLRRLRDPLGVGALVVAATAYLAFVDPNEAGHYPLCPTKALTGLDCPGCGGLRAVHSLTHGDLLGALNHNALVVLIVLPVAVALWVRWLVLAWRGDEQRSVDRTGAKPPGTAFWPRLSSLSSPRVLYPLLVLVVVFTVGRNISAVPALAWFGSTIS